MIKRIIKNYANINKEVKDYLVKLPKGIRMHLNALIDGFFILIPLLLVIVLIVLFLSAVEYFISEASLTVLIVFIVIMICYILGVIAKL